MVVVSAYDLHIIPYILHIDYYCVATLFLKLRCLLSLSHFSSSLRSAQMTLIILVGAVVVRTFKKIVI